ncbi:MAG: hypothetical protein CMJ78_11500 [Planctomycetaceae bacterium]|nr:hypothetical protein [Planctomycetaceae bacterium]
MRSHALKSVAIVVFMTASATLANVITTAALSGFCAQFGHDLPTSRSSAYAAGEAFSVGGRIGFWSGWMTGLLLAVLLVISLSNDWKLTRTGWPFLMTTMVALSLAGAFTGRSYALNATSYSIMRPMHVYLPAGLLGGLIVGSLTGVTVALWIRSRNHVRAGE